jgi:hypothetical protein
LGRLADFDLLFQAIRGWNVNRRSSSRRADGDGFLFQASARRLREGEGTGIRQGGRRSDLCGLRGTGAVLFLLVFRAEMRL